MSPERAEELIAIFPALFPSGSFFFECEDGWFDLLKECILELKKSLDADPLDLDPDFSYYVTQVKEKYGTLRFYTSLSPERLDPIIRKAEKASEITCEECGRFGRRRKGGWVRTLCDECVE